VVGGFVGRRVVVTGASRGIGASIAERFVAEGASVVITARTLEEHDHLEGSLADTVARCARYGTVVPFVADLADAADRARIIPESEVILGGPIDILVNNAAAEVNFHAPFDLAQAVIPSMVERGAGWIINVSSSSSDITDGPPFPFSPMGTTNAAYGATKAALNRYTNVLGVELYGTGVRVNTLQPVKPVASAGALIHLAGRLDPDRFNPVEVIVEATMALSSCGPDLTARICVDGPLLDELGRAVRELDGIAVLDPQPT
jgi:citronellol/citronellal dehydrogenase